MAKLSKQNLNFDSVDYYSDKAIEQAEKFESKNYLVYAYSIKGNLVSKDKEKAKPWLEKAIRMSLENEIDSTRAFSLNHLSQIIRREGHLDSAILLLNESLNIFQELQDSISIASVYNNLSITYLRLGDYEQSLKYGLASYNLYKDFGEMKRQIHPLINLGNVYYQLGKYDSAIRCFEIASERAFEGNDLRIYNKCRFNRAVIHLVQGEYEISLEIFLDVISFYERIDSKERLIETYNNLSIVYRELGQHEEKIEAIQKALQYAEDLNFTSVQIKALNNLAVYKEENQEYAEAKKYLLQSLHVARTSGYKLDVEKALDNLSKLSAKTKDYRNAYEYHMAYSDIKDSILNDKKVEAIAELEAKYEKKNDEAQILQLRNESAQKELEKKDIRLERNTIFGSSLTLVLMLSMGLFIYRYRLKKNKIIAEQKFQQLEDEKNLLEAQSVILGQENERKRIAQELHDGIGVLISTAKMHFSNVIKSAKDEQTKTLVKQANKLLKDAGEEVRGISHNMMPGVLSKFGLADAIEDMLDELDTSGEIEVVADLNVLKERLAEDTEIMLFRVVQEMVNNTLKYAKATEITLSAKKEEGNLLLHYSDNGKGFNVDDVQQDKSLGISGIRSRINFLGGKVTIESSPSKGCSFLVSVPLKG